MLTGMFTYMADAVSARLEAVALNLRLSMTGFI